MTVEKVRMGLAGFGGRCGHVAHTGQVVTGGGLQISAVFEPDDKQYDKACRQFNCIPERFSSVKEMADSGNIDVLLIGSPNQFHLSNLVEMLGQEIPIFIEKPLASSWSEICEVVRFARNYKASILVGHCMRYSPILQKAYELIVSNSIGRIGSVHFIQYCHYGNAMYHTWRSDMSSSGGMMIEKATHDFDVMQWLVNAKAERVFASGRQVAYGGDHVPSLRCENCSELITCPESPQNIHFRWVEGESFYEISDLENATCSLSADVNVPDDEICLIQFDNDVHGTYAHSYYTPRSFYHRVYQIIGTLGSMEINLGDEHGGKILLCNRYGTTGDKIEYNFDYLQRNHYNGDGFMMRHLYDVVRNNSKPQTTIEQAFIAEALGYAANISQKTQKMEALKTLIPGDLLDLFNKPLF